MCKYKGLIAVEIVNNVLIIRCAQVLQRHNTVVIISAKKNPDSRCINPDSLDALCRDTVPSITVFLLCYLVKDFEGKHVFILTKALGEFLPKLIEAFLVFFIFEKSCFLLSTVEAVSIGLMKVENHVQVILFSPDNSLLDICKAVLLIGSVLLLNKIIINGNSDVVKSP